MNVLKGSLLILKVSRNCELTGESVQWEMKTSGVRPGGGRERKSSLSGSLRVIPLPAPVQASAPGLDESRVQGQPGHLAPCLEPFCPRRELSQTHRSKEKQRARFLLQTGQDSEN